MPEKFKKDPWRFVAVSVVDGTLDKHKKLNFRLSLRFDEKCQKNLRRTRGGLWLLFLCDNNTYPSPGPRPSASTWTFGLGCGNKEVKCARY